MPNESGMSFSSDVTFDASLHDQDGGTLTPCPNVLGASCYDTQGIFNDTSNLATRLSESPSSRVSVGEEITSIPERQTVTELRYPRYVSAETLHTAISNLLSTVSESPHPTNQDNTEPHLITISNLLPSLLKLPHSPYQPDTETLSITISNPLSKVFATLIPMTPETNSTFRQVTSSRLSGGEEIPLAHRLYRLPVTDQEEFVPQEEAPGSTRLSTSSPGVKLSIALSITITNPLNTATLSLRPLS